jgi:hypothetical protein
MRLPNLAVIGLELIFYPKELPDANAKLLNYPCDKEKGVYKHLF